MSHGFLSLIDLAAARFGASVVAANDEFFASKDRLIVPEPANWIEDRYTERGKWMDGWETRRRREPGFDWCILRLGAPGVVCGVDVDTAHFRGNVPEACAIDVCAVDGYPAPATLPNVDWTEALPRTLLTGDTHNFFAVHDAPRATHLRLRIFPDGGVARLRVYGKVAADWTSLARRGEVDLAAAEHGAWVVACSDMFFGSRHNLIMPGDARTMGEGWETRRRRSGGHDWTVVRLATGGAIQRAEIDTRHFKGNAPESCSLEACTASTDVPAEDHQWRELMPRTPLLPDTRHVFERELTPTPGVTHVRLNIYPDGGVARLRLFGRPA
ncbi:MAG: allantoicase [Luteitalea sp.]|nr:allantoicase [Luteitalea sp.]